MATFSHPHHTHSLSYQEEDDGDDDDALRSSPVEYSPHSPTTFVSPPPSSMRPPSDQLGLQPDPGFFGLMDSRSSVGRFQIVEGSPSRGPMPEERSDGRRSVSPTPPLPPTYAHTHLAYPACARTFFTPHFPSMSVNGASVTLSIVVAVLPAHGVAISPSASGLEFTPPKIKWTPNSLKKEATFTATPLANAKVGKVKVCYILSGDDAGDYTEPPSTCFQMYSEDTPLPLPSPSPPTSEYCTGALFSPTFSDASDTSSHANGSHHSNGGGKNDRAAFLASGVPRQSGRFMVIDEEMQGDTPDSSPASSMPRPTPSPLSSYAGDSACNSAFDLLAQLHATISGLVEENARLRADNERLVHENDELRHTQTNQHYRQRERETSPPTQTPPTAARVLSSHATHQHQAQPSQQQHGLKRYATMGTPSTVPGNTRPASGHSSAHTSPPSKQATQQQQQQQHHHSHASSEKRQTLPANFSVPRAVNPTGAAGVPSAVHRLPVAQSNPSRTTSPNPTGSPSTLRRYDAVQSSSSTASPSRVDSAVKSKPSPSTKQLISPASRRRQSQDFVQQIEANLTASLQASVQNHAR